jgi:hypothetical protein
MISHFNPMKDYFGSQYQVSVQGHSALLLWACAGTAWHSMSRQHHLVKEVVTSRKRRGQGLNILVKDTPPMT